MENARFARLPHVSPRSDHAHVAPSRAVLPLESAITPPLDAFPTPLESKFHNRAFGAATGDLVGQTSGLGYLRAGRCVVCAVVVVCRCLLVRNLL